MYTINAHDHLHYVMDVILEHYYNNVPVSLSILETSNYALYVIIIHAKFLQLCMPILRPYFELKSLDDFL